MGPGSLGEEIAWRIDIWKPVLEARHCRKTRRVSCFSERQFDHIEKAYGFELAFGVFVRFSAMDALHVDLGLKYIHKCNR